MEPLCCNDMEASCRDEYGTSAVNTYVGSVRQDAHI
jgi:hypothetical protein